MRFEAFRLLPAAALLIATLAGCSDSDPTRPQAVTPTNVTAVSTSSTSIRVTFDAAPGSGEYIVERAPVGGAYLVAGNPSASPFDDAGLAAATTYRYRVASVRGSDTSAFSAERMATTAAVGAAGSDTLSGTIAANRLLDRDTVYVLRGFVKVANGATLTIQSGTRIVGASNVPGSALFILRGARIDAQGTADAPIVFTSSRAPGTRRPGDWGGLLLIGNGCINRTGAVILEGSNANIENGGAPGIDYGGNTAVPCPPANETDNSGTLQYVRVEFAGFAVANAQELNSFTLAAVGSGTTMHHLQSLSGLDDAFEWFGGSVNGRYLVSYESGDDHFDASEGYVGKNQFLIGLQTGLLDPAPGTGGIGDDPHGFEIDGCNGSGCIAPAGGNAQSANRFNMPVFANFTMVGTGDLATTSTSGGLGMHIRRGTGGTFVNGIVARYPRRGIRLTDSTTFNRVAADSLIITNILLAQNAGGNFDDDSVRVRLGAAAFEEASVTAASLFTALPAVGVSPTGTAQLDWTPAAGSPAATGGMSTFTPLIAARAGAFVVPTAYRGAADPAGAKWWAGWTTYARN